MNLAEEDWHLSPSRAANVAPLFKEQTQIKCEYEDWLGNSLLLGSFCVDFSYMERQHFLQSQPQVFKSYA
jgi:hypothetical protein